ncbi:SDR family oxidoreductase [Actinoplanes sp. NPDC051861]|uniref:SDR family oxidoreductase n=1 Tax=Actinoplanes sp. NPDC051861 TaxID=3155170 RepID=UPI00342ACE3D
MTTSTESAELVVVTGASTGIGAATARELARHGFHVLAGVRRERDAAAVREAGIEPVILDITDPDQIAALVARVGADPHGRPLRALVNNAGVAASAPVEALPIEQWRRVFEVNLFGHVAVTQALLPALVRSRGRIVNISSLNGRIAMAGYGPYAAGKFALEAVSDALRQELAPHGVQVVIVEPGGVRTELAGRGTEAVRDFTARMAPEHQDRYGDLMRAIPSHVAAFTRAGISAERAARGITRAVTDRRPRTRYTLGRDAAVLTRLSRVLPDRALDRMLAANLRPHMPSSADRAK